MKRTAIHRVVLGRTTPGLPSMRRAMIGSCAAINPPLRNPGSVRLSAELTRPKQTLRGHKGVSPMADLKRVFYVKYLAHNNFIDILRKRSDIRLDKLENDSPDDVATPVLAGAHAFQIGSARDELAKKYHADRDLLRRTQSLLIVSTNGAGYDTVNLNACTDAGVLVVNQAGGNKEAVAEHALAMMLSLTKKIVESDRATRRDKNLNRTLYIGHDLRYQTVGIVGLGNVGKRLAELCRGLFSMRVLACDPYVPADVMKANGAEKVELDELMQQADFVSINCPLTDETRGMVGAKQYALMKPNAYFVTTARGSIHDEKALEEALRAKKIAGAGLDVWEKEPPPLEHPLLQFDNVIVTPHTAGVTREARENMGRFAAEQMIAALDGKPVDRVLNPQVWSRYAARFQETFGFAPERGSKIIGNGQALSSV
jgi:D-3-phosphoglycerate dehydrogenase